MNALITELETVKKELAQTNAKLEAVISERDKKMEKEFVCTMNQ